MSLISVDVEADGPAPGPSLGSMVSFGAVLVKDMDKTFYGKTAPITDKWNPEALAISRISRKEHESYPDPGPIMACFKDWLDEVSDGRPTFISDNPAFDWQFINFYFHLFVGENPFGFSARRIGDLYCGLVKDGRKNRDWKRKLRKTAHTHHPVDDARGNAEAVRAMVEEMGLKMKL